MTRIFNKNGWNERVKQRSRTLSLGYVSGFHAVRFGFTLDSKAKCILFTLLPWLVSSQITNKRLFWALKWIYRLEVHKDHSEATLSAEYQSAEGIFIHNLGPIQVPNWSSLYTIYLPWTNEKDSLHNLVTAWQILTCYKEKLNRKFT